MGVRFYRLPKTETTTLPSVYHCCPLTRQLVAVIHAGIYMLHVPHVSSVSVVNVVKWGGTGGLLKIAPLRGVTFKQT